MSLAIGLSACLIVWYVCVHLVRLLGFVMHCKRVLIVSRPTIDTKSELGVSILRPMKGADEHLYTCLRSAFVQTYTNFEILLCVDKESDSSVPTARRLLAEFPSVNARILVGADVYGPNPKINNLHKGYKQAAHDIVWVLDSNVHVAPDALARAVPFFQPKISLVHHLPMAVSFGTGTGERLEEVYMSTAHSVFYTGINSVGIAACITGKSNLYKRSELDRATGAAPGAGLSHFAKYMAEDHMIAETLWAAGGRTAMAPDAAVQPLVAGLSLNDFVSRRVRWVRLRKYMVTAATLVEPSTDSFFACLLWVLGVYGLGYTTGLIQLMAVHFALWTGLDYANYWLLQKYVPRSWPYRSRPLAVWLFTWVYREALALPLWLWAMSGRSIVWRGKPFKIRRDLVAEEIVN